MTSLTSKTRIVLQQGDEPCIVVIPKFFLPFMILYYLLIHNPAHGTLAPMGKWNIKDVSQDGCREHKNTHNSILLALRLELVRAYRAAEDYLLVIM